MKNKLFLFAIVLVLAAEIAVLAVFATRLPDTQQDAVAVNEVLQSVTRDFDDLTAHKNETALDYAVLDADGNAIFKTKSGLSETVAAAIAHRDTILDVVRGDTVAGKVIIYNDGAIKLGAQRRTAFIVLAAAVAVQCVLCVAFAAYLYVTIVKPFRKLKGFAMRVAGGNLDVPLEMDKGNLFGAFTESFDIMRSELRRARLAEAQADKSKKELVAKLSHDIRTPIVSIKAVSEVGLAVAENPKDEANYTRIINKTDQINALVTNLFTATLEELRQLSVSPVNLESVKIKALIENADYLHRAVVPDMPECLVYADGLRLQQVFDNIFANSYKYANTGITVTVVEDGKRLSISVEDEGGGVPDGELALIKEKFGRGSNAANTEGAGLGLFISDCFMKEMGGELNAENGERGLKATVVLALSGKN